MNLNRTARTVALTLAALACAALTLAPAASAKDKIAIAPIRACPGQTEPTIPAADKVAAMLCMTNFARAANGLQPLTEVRSLRRAAYRKDTDILTCDEFSHEACGRTFTYWINRSGYLAECGSAGENIAWGTGTLGSVRSIFSAWMNSAGHRENILGRYTDVGTAFVVGELDGTTGAVVWTQDFGSHSC